jgi:hypothetical protein
MDIDPRHSPTNMVIKKPLLSIILMLLAFGGYLQLLGVHGNQLHIEASTTKLINRMNEIGIIDNPVHLELFNDGITNRFYLKVSIGTPTQEVLMILDSGGGEPWIPCSNHQLLNQKFDRFHPFASSTYQSILCNSQLCKPYASSSLSCNLDYPIPCNFSELYADGEHPKGVLLQDTFTLSPHDVQIPNIMFGCIYEGVEGYKLSNGWIYGIIGLTPRPRSFFDQISNQLGRFPIISFCLAAQSYDADAKSWIAFGGQSLENLSFTPLVGRGFFSVNLKGITVDNVDVDVSNITTLAYDPISQVGGYILDTGSDSTWLQEPLHSRFTEAFVAAMKKRMGVDPDPFDINDHNDNICYTFGNDVNISNIQVPNVVFHFENNVDLHLEVENLFFIESSLSEDNQRTWCLAFKNFKNQIYNQVLGSTILQNFHVEINLERSKVGFSRMKYKTT